jgi:hypothetical protein|nr:MAG TPA: hypothetical protein [Caudoviricetes sp.]
MVNRKFANIALLHMMALAANNGTDDIFGINHVPSGNTCTGRETKHPQERRKSRKKKEFGAPNLTKKQRKQLKSK